MEVALPMFVQVVMHYPTGLSWPAVAEEEAVAPAMDLLEVKVAG